MILKISNRLQIDLLRRLYLRRCFSSQDRPSSSVKSSTAQHPQAKVDPIEEYTVFGNLRNKKSIWHYSDRKSGTGYSDYSSSVYVQRPYIWPPMRKLFYFNNWLAVSILLGAILLQTWFGDTMEAAANKFMPEASQLTNEEIEAEKGAGDGESDEKEVLPVKPKKKKLGFRERRIIQYEDRLRLYSTPDKIFRYFATLKVTDKEGSGKFEVFMTPEDFLRSLTPGVMQPRKWGLDSFKVYDPEKHRHLFSDPTSIFYKLGENGLISFGDYLFLMTLLSTSPNDFALAFKIFDINGDGALDKEEFQKVQQLIMSQTTVGQRHRDHITPTSSFRVESNSALEAYFFGKGGHEKLSSERFLDFQHALHQDILKMEFTRRDALDGVDGLISEESFARLLLMHAQIPEKKQKIMIKRVRKQFKSGEGITLDETKDFFQVLYHIEDVDMALHFHRMAGQAVGAPLLKRVALKVAGVNLTDHLIDVVITLFDDNQDGMLSNNEMIAIMRRRMRRGLERPRDTGLFRFVEAVGACSKRVLHNSHIPAF